MTTQNGKSSDDNVISLAEARARIAKADITQDELAVLARLTASDLGLHKARKLVRSNVSLFFTRKLPEGHAFDAVKRATEKYLGVEIDINLDVA